MATVCANGVDLNDTTVPFGYKCKVDITYLNVPKATIKWSLIHMVN